MYIMNKTVYGTLLLACMLGNCIPPPPELVEARKRKEAIARGDIVEIPNTYQINLTAVQEQDSKYHSWLFRSMLKYYGRDISHMYDLNRQTSQGNRVSMSALLEQTKQTGLLMYQLTGFTAADLALIIQNDIPLMVSTSGRVDIGQVAGAIYSADLIMIIGFYGFTKHELVFHYRGHNVKNIKWDRLKITIARVLVPVQSEQKIAQVMARINRYHETGGPGPVPVFKRLF